MAEKRGVGAEEADNEKKHHTEENGISTDRSTEYTGLLVLAGAGFTLAPLYYSTLLLLFRCFTLLFCFSQTQLPVCCCLSFLLLAYLGCLMRNKDTTITYNSYYIFLLKHITTSLLCLGFFVAVALGRGGQGGRYREME